MYDPPSPDMPASSIYSARILTVPTLGPIDWLLSAFAWLGTVVEALAEPRYRIVVIGDGHPDGVGVEQAFTRRRAEIELEKVMADLRDLDVASFDAKYQIGDRN